MKNNHVLVVAIAAALFSAASVLAGETGKSVVLAKADQPKSLEDESWKTEFVLD